LSLAPLAATIENRQPDEREAVMAISFYFHPESFSAAQYDDVTAKLEQAGFGAPDGRLLHSAFEMGDNIHVFDIWESMEKFEAFGPTLMPILAGAGVDPGEPGVAPVHNMIVA
jgi:hypothetical protein